MESTKDKYELCKRLTAEAMAALKVTKRSAASDAWLKFAKDYIADAEHYAKKGEYATALEAIAYAHGFIDAGVLAGNFRIDGYHLEKV